MEFQVLAALTVCSVLFSVFCAIYYIPRMVNKREEAIVEMLEAFINETKEQIDPIVKTNSRAMGMIADKSVTVRQEKSAMKALGQDLIDNNEMIISAVEMVSPLFAEKLRGNPQMVVSLLPQIKQILGNTDPDFLKNLTGGIQGGKTFKGHPFMNRKDL